MSLKIKQDHKTGNYFVVGATGPVSWRYHKWWLAAWFELVRWGGAL